MRPLSAAFLSKRVVIFMFLRQIGLNLKVFSSILMSASISIDSMNLRDLLEN